MKCSQAACLDEDGSGADADAGLLGEANPAPPELKQDKAKKSAPGSDSGHRRRPT